MTRRTDRDPAASLKAKVALAAVRGDKTLAELAAQFNLDPEQIAEWKRELESNAEAAFGSDVPPSEMPTLPPIAKPPIAPIPREPAGPQPSARMKAPTLPTFEQPPTLPQWPSGPKSLTLPKAGPGDRLDDDFWGGETLQTSGVKTLAGIKSSRGVATGAHPPPREKPGWARKLLGPLIVGWQEKQYAAKTSRELLKLYGKISSERPGITKLELYRQIVMARTGGTLAAANAVLARATESFATWPVERALTFRDVVHYLAVSDYLATNAEAADWTRENLGRVVASLIPENL
jgi:transposase-like protein